MAVGTGERAGNGSVLSGSVFSGSAMAAKVWLSRHRREIGQVNEEFQ